MQTLLPVLIGVLVAAGVYRMLGRHLLGYVLGLVLFSSGVNLVLFAAGRLTRLAPAFVPEGVSVPTEALSNALPQALILTAIVIGFGLLVFTLVLLLRAEAAIGTLDVDDFRPEAGPVAEKRR
jgi:multicomponent Na+:H+ antiporter subunit C